MIKLCIWRASETCDYSEVEPPQVPHVCRLADRNVKLIQPRDRPLLPDSPFENHDIAGTLLAAYCGVKNEWQFEMRKIGLSSNVAKKRFFWCCCRS
jgi:hypothetical protein